MEPTTASVMEQSVALTLSFTRLGTKRSASKDSIECEADKDMLHLGKDLLDSPELRAITSRDGFIRRWVAARALPSPLFKSGTFIIPVGLVEDVYAGLEKFKVDRDTDIDAFIATYPAKKAEAKERLKDLYNAAQYPTADVVKGAFEMKWYLIEFSTPGKVKKISKAIYEKERAKAEAEWAGATEQIRNALRVAMAELVEHMVERLAADDDGKAKTFKTSMITKFAEFADLFGKRNLTGDAELAALVEKAQKVMTGVDAAGLRSDSELKTRVAEGFAEIKATLDTMVVNRPTRAINLSEDV